MSGAAGAPRRIVLWRHGQTAWNLADRFQGQLDIDLTDTGRAQARRAAAKLADLPPDAIICSDLRRTRDTAAELASVTGLDVTYDDALRETYAGDWQGLTHTEIRERFGDQYEAWRRGEPVRRGGGELETEVADRAAPVVERTVEKLPPGGVLVVVSHGGAIRTTIGRLLGLPPQTWEALGGLTNCCWSVLGESVRGWRLLEHNANSLPERAIGDDV
ncbi:histidine phosphatase family protein [Streptomyces sp. RFCAC02]|uniref:histidine phosphatase family protein n=1 Tax=Streptomyces sp. RFCAC02 TaxID=2499143 RepID=UPI00102198A5|nr:histidine phosphatase family protein [Streptomyces sp. RFCAC02]